MQVKIKKLHPNAVIPSYAIVGDAGLDLTCTEINYNEENATHEYKTGLAIEIPTGHLGLIFPRSSIRNTRFRLANSVGLIDPNFRGQLIVSLKSTFSPSGLLSKHDYKVGDRVAQLVLIPYPTIELVEVSELSESNRGEAGHGSTNIDKSIKK